MINPNEIKVGNLVLYNGKKLLFDEEQARYFFDVKDEWVYLDPIPLTPEILEKAGFVKINTELEPVAFNYSLEVPVKGDNKNEIHFTVVQMGNQESFGNALVNDHWASNNFQHLHQLQNLYFALTGEELTLNLPLAISDTRQ